MASYYNRMRAQGVQNAEKLMVRGAKMLGSSTTKGYKAKPLGSFKKGGSVKKTGLYKLHKGEKVVPVSKVKKSKKK